MKKKEPIYVESYREKLDRLKQDCSDTYTAEDKQKDYEALLQLIEDREEVGNLLLDMYFDYFYDI